MDGWEKMVTSSFGEAALGVSQARAPFMTTPSAWADLPFRWVKHECHVGLGLACPCPRREPGPHLHVGTLGILAALPIVHSQTY